MSQDETGPPPATPDDESLEPGMPSPGPAWHRASMRPEGAEPAALPPGDTSGTPPAAGATTTAGGDAEPPAGPPGGGHLAAGVFLTAAALSIFAGLLALLAARHVDFPANAIACGAAFAVLFVLAVGRRGRISPVRGALGVVAVFFLAACFAFAVDLGGSGPFSEQSVRVKLASAAAVFALGQGIVGVAVPSAVAAGFAVLGVEGAVLLSLTAAGSPSPSDMVVAGLVTAVVLLLVALRVPRLRPHPGGLGWMLGVGAVLAAGAALALAGDANGVAIAATGFLTLALALLAWRHRAVAPAIAAVPCLLVVEAYVVARVTGDHDATGEAVVILASGAVLFLLVGIGAVAARQWSIADGARRVLAEELLLVAAGVLALLALGQSSQPVLPFLRSGLGIAQPVQPAQPFLHFSTFEPLPAPSQPSLQSPTPGP